MRLDDERGGKNRKRAFEVKGNTVELPDWNKELQ